MTSLVLDTESIELYGETIAVGCMVIDGNGRVIESLFLYCDHNLATDLPANNKGENVVPTFENCISLKELRNKFWEFYSKMKWEHPGLVVADCGPCEAGFFRECVMDSLDRQLSAPFPLH